MSKAIDAFVQQNETRFLEELNTFLRIPSISTLPEHKGDVNRAAQFVADSLKQAGMDYFVDTPEGLAKVQFSDRNRFGILDHRVTLPGGRSVYVPLRVAASGKGCALTLTLFRRPEASDAEFEADAQWVMRDLQAAKRLLEAR